MPPSNDEAEKKAADKKAAEDKKAADKAAADKKAKEKDAPPPPKLLAGLKAAGYKDAEADIMPQGVRSYDGEGQGYWRVVMKDGQRYTIAFDGKVLHDPKKEKAKADAEAERKRKEAAKA